MVKRGALRCMSRRFKTYNVRSPRSIFIVGRRSSVLEESLSQETVLDNPKSQNAFRRVIQHLATFDMIPMQEWSCTSRQKKRNVPKLYFFLGAYGPGARCSDLHEAHAPLRARSKLHRARTSFLAFAFCANRRRSAASTPVLMVQTAEKPDLRAVCGPLKGRLPPHQ